MAQQLALDFDARRLPTNGTPTSQAAAASLRGHVGRLEAVVLDAVRAAGDHGLTGEEIEAETGLSGNTARPRLVTLRGLGLVMKATDDEGQVVTRPTRSGRQAVVWRTTEDSTNQKEHGEWQA